jgi:hypothetical protein
MCIEFAGDPIKEEAARLTKEVEGEDNGDLDFEEQPDEPKADSGAKKYRDVKTSTEELRARKLEIEIGQMEERLLDANEVRLKITKLVGEVRDAFLGLASKLAPVLIGVSDPIETENILKREINETLASLSKLEPEDGKSLLS